MTATPTATPMIRLTWVVSLMIILAAGVLCQQIVSHSISNQANKNDYAKLNDVRYGLFSVEEWRRQVTAILVEEIDELYLSKANEQALRKHLEPLLNTLIDKVDKKIKEENSGSAGGLIAQSFINIFVSLEDIKKGIPEYADAVIHEMMKPETRRLISTTVSGQLEQYSNEAHNAQATSELSRIVLRTHSRDVEGARIALAEDISIQNELIALETILLILLSLLLFAMSGASGPPPAPAQYIVLLLSLLLLLIAGVTTPMIDMEAKISRMSFTLMGHSIHFENQILYFQSKSILDIFWIMMTHKDIQMKLVAVLLMAFSLVFPALKMVSSLGYYYNYRHARENPVINFFVFRSGKWSMADVMVVAIFMAYIGFNGIITSQLGQLSLGDQEPVIVATNGTALQPGYYLFLTYTLLALFFSGLLTRRPHAPGPGLGHDPVLG